jgi:pyruvate carboxylase
MFQSKQLGLSGKWSDIKHKYAAANRLLGDIPKVTPSSKVVGDLAQFLVAQGLEASDVIAQVETLALPDSVVNYLRGEIGQPPGGFPEPLRTRVLEARGLTPIDGRPGATMPDYDFDEARKYLEERYGKSNVSDKDLLSYALYPKEYVGFKDFQATFGSVGALPTHLFLNPMKAGDEVEIELGVGKVLNVKLASIQDAREDGKRVVVFEVNGEPWYIPVIDKSIVGDGGAGIREKATLPNHVGASMPGVVVGLKVNEGNRVEEGETVATLSAMKMETSIPAPVAGVVKRVLVTVGAKVEGGDLIMEIEESE